MVIYKITNTINDKVYIGQTNDIKRRMSEHRRKNTLPIDKDIVKYGIENFKVEIIDEANNREELDAKEIHYISLYNSITPNGYNLTLGGKTTRGYKHREESKEKMSVSKKKNIRKYIGENNSFFGRKHSDESKKKMSVKRKNMQHLTEEQKNKLWNSHITKKVICVETNEVFNSIKEASEKYNILGTHIVRVCKGKRKTTGGYHWKYYNS